MPVYRVTLTVEFQCVADDERAATGFIHESIDHKMITLDDAECSIVRIDGRDDG